MSESVQQTYPYSIKIEPDTKGFNKVTVHVYSCTESAAVTKAVSLLKSTKDLLKASGEKVLE